MQEHCLLLTVALPDIWAEDLTQEEADEFFDGDLMEMVHENMGLLSDVFRLTFLFGDRTETRPYETRAVLVGVSTVEREKRFEELEDERMTAFFEEDGE